MSAESDARMLTKLREWRQSNAELLAKLPNSYRVPMYLDEFDLLLRIADERDQLRRDLCEEQQGRGHRPLEAAPDPKYVVRECPDCHHEPHGIGFLCMNRSCGCRNERPTQ